MPNITLNGQKDKLKYYVGKTRDDMGRKAAEIAGDKIKQLLEEKDEVRIIFASAPSQDEVISNLINDKDIDWSRIVGFHMDEYIGLPLDADQWFKKYIETNILDKVDMKAFHFIDGTKPAEEEINRYTNLLNEKPIDVVCLGVGENGHIAFNDPPVADFNDPKMVKVVELDQFSRQQQVNDGAFEALKDVPKTALTLTIPALTAGGTLVCTVPGETKTEAIQKMLNDDITTACPATILRKHDEAYLIVDSDAYGL